MGILAKNKLNLAKRGIFGAITGRRLAGKTTLAGTLPGKTAMFTADLFETGASSAIALAKSLGNTLDVYTFDSISSLVEMIEEASTEYDNIYIDSATGVTELMYRSTEISAAIKKNSWDGFRLLADRVEDLMLRTKSLTEKSGLNIFYTISLVENKDSILAPESKGNSVVKNIRAIFPVVVALSPKFDDDGNLLPPDLVTASDGEYAARIDGLLTNDNPGIIEPDLSKLINLLKGE